MVALLASSAESDETRHGEVAGLMEGFRQALSSPRLQRRLLGTAGSWFLFDVAAYGNLARGSAQTYILYTVSTFDTLF